MYLLGLGNGFDFIRVSSKGKASSNSFCQFVSGRNREARLQVAFSREASRHAPARTVFTTNTSTLHQAARWRASSIGRRSSSPCTLPSACGTPISARSWAIRGPTRKCSSGCSSWREDRPGAHPYSQGAERLHACSARPIVPWCTAALELLVRGVSDVESIDRTWMITLQSDMGPFGMMDRMGLGVVHHVAKLMGETTPNTQALSTPATSTSTSSRRTSWGLRAARASTATRILPSPSPGSSKSLAEPVASDAAEISPSAWATRCLRPIQLHPRVHLDRSRQPTWELRPLP